MTAPAPGRFPIEIGDLVARLADQASALARDLLPAGIRRGSEWCVAAADNPMGCSVSVHLAGGKSGVWGAWAAGKGGDALDLIAAVKFAGDKKQAIRWALDWLRIDPKDRDQLATVQGAKEARSKATVEPSSEAKRSAAWRLWLAATPLTPGDPAYHYLSETRGIDFTALGRMPGALRYCRALTWSEEVGETEPTVIPPWQKWREKKTGAWWRGRKWPALVAAVTGAGGRFLTLHRTWLEEQSDGRVLKAPIFDAKGKSDARKVYGAYRGGTIRLARGASGKAWKDAPTGDVLGLTESIEDGLTYAVAVPEHRVAAALSVGNLAHLRLPPAIGTVIVAADNDAPGSQADQALQRAVARFLAEGRQVRIARCPAGVKDLNDLLLETG